MKNITKLSLAALLPLLCACNHLTREAKEIVGVYYNPEISQTEPIMELNRDGSCVITAIKPGVLTYSVEGEWNVERDSLTMELDPSTVKSEGDSTLIGSIPAHFARKVISFTDYDLQLEQDGVTYLYQRRQR